jgi:hypothetical protein
MVNSDSSMDTNGLLVAHPHSFSFQTTDTNTTSSYLLNRLPPPLYNTNPIGLCTRCEALADDADAKLTPVNKPKGFRIVTRVKIGYGGFNPADKTSATKSFKRCWQADKPGAEISFRFYGSSVKIAIWQRRDSMGVIHAYVDNDQVHYDCILTANWICGDEFCLAIVPYCESFRVLQGLHMGYGEEQYGPLGNHAFI